jgi:hypothetical protein
MRIILETPRLTVRQFTEDDVDEYALTRPEWESGVGPDGVRLYDGAVQEVNTGAREDAEPPRQASHPPDGLVFM